MSQQPPGDFATLLESANRMTQSSVAHPFGAQRPPLARVGQGPQIPVQQTTRMFFCPQDLELYDELCNRAFAGEIDIRYEERTPLVKEGKVMVIISYMTPVQPAPRLPGNDQGGNDQEPEVRAHRIP